MPRPAPRSLPILSEIGSDSETVPAPRGPQINSRITSEVGGRMLTGRFALSLMKP